MSRDGSGTYSLPANTLAVSGDAISSTKFNSLVQDLEADANVDRPIAAGGTGASTASAARTNLGLAIGTDVQAFDAGLLSIAGLTTLADRSIYTTASDTYAVYTLTAAGRAILDDADAAAQRTTLGLGTAALKNTGTSGDAVPLLNVANTFSPLQTFTNPGNASFGAAIELKTTAGTDDIALAMENYNGGSPVRYALSVKDDGALAFSSGRYTGAIGTERMTLSSAGVLAVGGNTVWHAGNDGAGSGLDADTLDGYNVGTSGATIPLLNGVNTFGGHQIFLGEINIDSNGFARHVHKDGGTAVWSIGLRADNDANFYLFQESGAGSFVVTGSGFTYNANTVWHAGNDGAGSGLDADTLDGDQGSAFAKLASPDFSGTPTISSAAIVSVSATQTLSNKTLTSPTINGGTSSTRVIASSETTGTLTVASANRTIQATGDITIPNAVFAKDDIILIYAGASARTITQGASVTMRLGGTATTGSRTLAARGVAMLFFVSSSEVVVSGGAVT